MTYGNSIRFSETITSRIPGMYLGILETAGFTIAAGSEYVQTAYHNLFSNIENKFAEVPPSSDEVVSHVRRMYRRIGWEPTRYRPSSEAMIRRILKRKGLYNINNAVDLGNVASARFHLPMGLYDMDKIQGEVVVDVGRQKESYAGLSIDLIHADGKLILRDEQGIFGNPTADSKRTCIDQQTQNVMALFFIPPEILQPYVYETLLYLRQLYAVECPAACFQSYIVSSR